MRLLDTLTITYEDQPRRIALYHGDLSAMPRQHAVDVLILSAVPGSYSPARGSVIRALHEKGISVAELAQRKAIDLRANFACWLSDELAAQQQAAVPVRRILCFEPPTRDDVPVLVGGIFQSLTPFTLGEITGEPLRSAAMSLVSSRTRQGIAVADLLEPLLDAAAHWMQIGLPLEQLNIVEFDERKAYEAKGVFGVLKKRYGGAEPAPAPARRRYTHDLFISYSHENTAEAQFVVDELLRLDPELRIFFDRRSLNTGSAWQQALYDALDDCHKVVALYSPTYLTSKVCKEEFNIALFRHRETDGQTLVPLYLYSASLPTYMQLIQFTDCREADRAKLRAACATLIAGL